jgi:hypothetical protein
VSDKTSSEPTLTFIGSNVPTFPFALPTGGAEPPCVSQVYPENVNSLGPVTDELLPDDPLLEVPLPDDPLLEVPLPDDPLLEVPPPDDPLLEVPLPDDPLLEVPLPDDPLLAEPPWVGTKGMLPPPQPTVKRIANTKTLILSIKYPFQYADRD